LDNGKCCKDPKLAKAEDFFFSGFNNFRNTSNPKGSTVTLVHIAQMPRLGTLDISLATHQMVASTPRAIEILVVVEGALYVGLVTSNPDNHLNTKVQYFGDVSVLVSFTFNLMLGKPKLLEFAKTIKQL
ncbi:hypothetical protein Golob_022804, partial [Gossypium lobatum]|nr:hypothetical protein [Gossypium lobatum]